MYLTATELLELWPQVTRYAPSDEGEVIEAWLEAQIDSAAGEVLGRLISLYGDIPSALQPLVKRLELYLVERTILELAYLNEDRSEALGVVSILDDRIRLILDALESQLKDRIVGAQDSRGKALSNVNDLPERRWAAQKEF